MNYDISRNEIEKIRKKISIARSEQRSINDEIKRLNQEAENYKLDEQLFQLKIQSPIIIPTDEYMNKYRFLSEKIYIEHIGIFLYPLWLKLECTYPEWSNDHGSVNVVQYHDFNSGKGYEILMEGIHKATGWFYDDCKQLITKYNLTIPPTYYSDYRLHGNINIDYNKAEPIEAYERKKKKYCLVVTDDAKMVYNDIDVKFILILPE